LILDGYVFVAAKYVLDLLSETWMLDFRVVDAPMDYHVKLDANMGELFADVG